MVIECLTLIVHSIGQQKSQSFANKLIETIMVLQETISDEKDPLKLYLIWGWQRLLLTLKKNLTFYMDRFLPPLIKLLTVSLTEIKEETEGEKDSENSEIIATIQLIDTIVEEIGEHISSHLLTLIQLLMSVITNGNFEDEVRKKAVKPIPKTLEILKKNDEAQCLFYGKYFVGVFFYSIAQELEPSLIFDFVQSIKDCISIMGFYLSEFELSEISKKIIKIIYDSDQRKNHEKNNNFEEIDLDEMEILKERINKEEDLQIAIAQLIGILFKTHRNLCLKFAEFLYNEVVLRVCHPNLSDKIHKLCLALIDDMIEYLGRDLLKEKWIKMAEILMNFLTDPCVFVREAAHYGIGIFAIQAKEEFQNFVHIYLTKTKEAYQIIQNPNEKQRAFLHCKDNITASLGKVIRFHSDKINFEEAFSIWVQNLPLKFEKSECIFQHEILANFVFNNNELPIQNKILFEKIIKIFAEILESRLINESTKQILKACFQRWINEPFKNEFMNIFKNLSLSEQNKIEEVLKESEFIKS